MHINSTTFCLGSLLMLAVLGCLSGHDSTNSPHDLNATDPPTGSLQGELQCLERITAPECLEDLRRMNDFGGVDSIFDAASCVRKGCGGDADCDAPWRCMDVPYSVFNCHPENPLPGDGCLCGSPTIFRAARVCMPPGTRHRILDPEEYSGDLTPPSFP